MHDPTVALPDEGRLDFPSSWRRFTLPKRGQTRPAKIEFNSTGPRHEIAEQAEGLRRDLALPENAEFQDAGLAFLSGEADSLGAAAVGVLLGQNGGDYHRTLRPMFDLVEVDHGLPAAVCAATELMCLWTAAAIGRTNKGGPVAHASLQRLEPHQIGWRWPQLNVHIAEVRLLIAAATDVEYAHIVKALTEHRNTPVKRLAATILVPYEQDWLDEVCAEFTAVCNDQSIAQALLRIITTRDQWHAIGSPELRTWTSVNEVASLVDRLGVDAFPVLKRSLDQYTSSDTRQRMLKAIGLLPTDDAMAYLAHRIDQPHILPVLIDAAARFPGRVLRAIAPAIAAAPAEKRAQFAAVVQSDPRIVDAALPTLGQEVRDAVAQMLAEQEPFPAAPVERLPHLLASPPWTVKRAKRRPVVIDGLTPPPIDKIAWAEGEREAWAGAESAFGTQMSDRDWEARSDRFGIRPFYVQTEFLGYAPVELAKSRLPEWKAPTGDPYWPVPDQFMRILARFEHEVAERVTESIGVHASLRACLPPLVNLKAARLAADALVRLKSARAIAAAWLDRHHADAATLLIPDALGTDKSLRDAAEGALHYLIASHGPDPVLAAAVQYGPEARAAIKDLTKLDPLEPVGVKIPKIGSWASPAVLPQVLLKGREAALPRDSVRHLITVLALATPEYPYPGIEIVAETCDRESLARFSWALFEQWLTVGSPTADLWALTQLVHFGDDDVVRDLTCLIREWPGQSQHQRAVKGLTVLGVIGTETALRALHQVSQKVKFKALKSAASRQIDAIASGLGLTAEQLADRLVPDFGLDEESALPLDYGPRWFTVRFDEQLKPFVTDMDGKPRKSLPKPGANDDADLAEAAYQRFAQLKKELRAVSVDQVKRMEHAMIDGRTWTVEEFRTYLVEHPLVRNLTQRLVWLADSDGRRVAFRLAEDGGFADIGEDELELRADAAIRLAHPVQLGDQVGAWAEILADYEIHQPFAQLARPVMDFTEDERSTGRLARFEGRKVPTGSLLGLTHKGWERMAPQDGGWEPGMIYDLPGVGTLILDLDPGIVVGSVQVHPEQVLNAVRVAGPGGRRSGGEGPDLRRIDPVTASEVLTALANLAKTT